MSLPEGCWPKEPVDTNPLEVYPDEPPSEPWPSELEVMNHDLYNALLTVQGRFPMWLADDAKLWMQDYLNGRNG